MFTTYNIHISQSNLLTQNTNVIILTYPNYHKTGEKYQKYLPSRYKR